MNEHGRSDYQNIKKLFTEKIKPGEPWMVFRGQDKLMKWVIRIYRFMLWIKRGQPKMRKNLKCMSIAVKTWQLNNYTKMPDMP